MKNARPRFSSGSEQRGYQRQQQLNVERTHTKDHASAAGTEQTDDKFLGVVRELSTNATPPMASAYDHRDGSFLIARDMDDMENPSNEKSERRIGEMLKEVEEQELIWSEKRRAPPLLSLPRQRHHTDPGPHAFQQQVNPDQPHGISNHSYPLSPMLSGDDYEEKPLSAAEVREQQTNVLFREGTVAVSGYVSACVSRLISNQKSYEELRECDTKESPEAQSRLTADQQTVYTSSVLPHGSDYVSDLCNDIHMNLKYELERYAHGQAQIELPKRLPDLIKAFSIRIGLDTSKPSTAYIMHFLHTNYRSV